MKLEPGVKKNLTINVNWLSLIKTDCANLLQHPVLLVSFHIFTTQWMHGVSQSTRWQSMVNWEIQNKWQTMATYIYHYHIYHGIVIVTYIDYIDCVCTNSTNCIPTVLIYNSILHARQVSSIITIEDLCVDRPFHWVPKQHHQEIHKWINCCNGIIWPNITVWT